MYACVYIFVYMDTYLDTLDEVAPVHVLVLLGVLREVPAHRASVGEGFTENASIVHELLGDTSNVHACTTYV